MWIGSFLTDAKLGSSGVGLLFCLKGVANTCERHRTQENTK